MEIKLDRLLRFDDLKALGIVRNRPTLYRLMKKEGFPPGALISANSRAWTQTSVREWLAARGLPVKSAHSEAA